MRVGVRKLCVAVVVSLCALVGGLVFASAPVLAAAPETPETGKAGAVAATTATLEDGVLNPNAAGEVGEYEYRFRVSETECEGERSSAPGMALGAKQEAVPAVQLSELQPNAKYTFCLVERNLGGEQSAASTPAHFTTKAAAPTVESESVSSVASSGARLEAVVNANNEEVGECKFQYGTEASLAASTTVGCEQATLPGIYGGQGVGVNVSGLRADMTYYYRVFAKNATGVEQGTVARFQTLPETPETGKAEPVAATTATLHGVLNPKTAGEPGTYEFVYRPSGSSPTSCQGEGEGASTATASTGSSPEPVSTEVTGLVPGTRYTFCVRAGNEEGAQVLGAPATFTTPPAAPVIEAESSSDVSATEARLEATINPGNSQTAYHFEYGPAAGSYDTSIPVPSHEIPAGLSGVSVSAVATGLAPGTTYHYRVVATNALPGAVDGTDQTFTTLAAQVAGSPPGCPNEQLRTEQPYGAELPDCRAYELVSPVDTDGSNAIEPRFVGFSRASVSGEALAFSSKGAFAGPVSAPYYDELLSRRGSGGWFDGVDRATAV